MQFRVRKFAHVLERTGLAMAGAASGLFVAVQVGSSIATLTSQGFIVVMMIAGRCPAQRATTGVQGNEKEPRFAHGLQPIQIGSVVLVQQSEPFEQR